MKETKKMTANHFEITSEKNVLSDVVLVVGLDSQQCLKMIFDVFGSATVGLYSFSSLFMRF